METRNIGYKVKNVRIEANFTQEQEAEALGVSRQIIPNWGNEKTYPGIVSVVKMSGLYFISLDYRLKGERSMPNYLGYLEKSTNVVKSKNKRSKFILIAAYLGIWTISLIAFWFFTSGADAMGYGIIFLWVLLPVTTFVISVLIGKNNYWGKEKWISAIAFGMMYMLAEYATFSAANTVSFDKINIPRFEMIPIGAIISAIGLGLGAAINHLKLKSEIFHQKRH